MTARTPLPARILIPVANPMTAEELIRLGAAMLVVWLNGRGQVRKTPSFRRISRSTPTRGPHP